MKEGFSLIEIVIALAIIGILVAISIVTFRPLRQQADINATAHQIVSVLQLARNRTVSAVNDTNYGVHFASDEYVLFTGSSYNPSATDNEPYAIPDAVEVNSISVGGNDVVFDRLTGSTSNDGTIQIRLTADTTQTRTITILESGLVGLSGTVSPTDTREVDSRHLHFDLGWSLQGATTLTLNFPNDGVTENVTMADYFNSDQTEFDWSGTITVDGAAQEMRVHTHSLDATDTELSIHRDGRYNDKDVTISVDGQEIVSYDADGTATVGASGGTMTPQ